MTVRNADVTVVHLLIPLIARVLCRVNSLGRALVLRAQSHEQHIGRLVQNAILEKVSQITVTNKS